MKINMKNWIFNIISIVVIILFNGCETASNKFEIKKSNFGDTIIIDSIFNKKICSRTIYIKENIYIYTSYQKQYKIKFNLNGVVIKKTDLKMKFDYTFFNNGKIKSIMKKDSFDKVYYYNEYDSLNNILIETYRHILDEITFLDKDTILFSPKIHTKFDNIDKYNFFVKYDSTFKIVDKKPCIIKIKDGYKLYCKANCGWIIKICDSVGCYSFPFEIK